LCDFLGKPQPETPFPRENVARATGKASLIDRTMQDTWIMKKSEMELRKFFSFVTAVVAIIIAFSSSYGAGHAVCAVAVIFIVILFYVLLISACFE